jgi:hypothetical protein
LSQFFIPGSAHFDGRAAVAIVAPMTLEAIESFACATTVTHKNVGLLFFVSRRKSHAFLFEILAFSGCLKVPFYLR